jgi:hypothetical protein
MLVLSVVALAAPNASAQYHSKWYAQMDADVSIPVAGDMFTSAWKEVGFGGGAGVGAHLNKWIGIYANANYSVVALDESKTTGATTPFKAAADAINTAFGGNLASVTGGEAQILYFSLNGKLQLMPNSDSRLKPYFLAGAGIYRSGPDRLRYQWRPGHRAALRVECGSVPRSSVPARPDGHPR